MEKQIILNSNKRITKCTKCKNNTKFTAHSERAGEDFCDIWVVCKCGYDPTKEVWGHRIESVFGELTQYTMTEALIYSWNAALLEIKEKTTEIGK